MPKSIHQKRKLLLLRDILLARTDEDHPISTQQLIHELERCGVRAERKSIYDDMETLRLSGLDVQSRKGRKSGWFVGKRDFELPELKLLVDAVQASRFITRRKSGSLVCKLESLVSLYQARQLQRQVYVSGQIKAMNESIYHSIDKLYAAIGGHKAITFRYFDYSCRKEKVYRREGRRYSVSPYGLIWDNENYYLVGLDAARREIRHYRVDKMSEIAVTCLSLEAAPDSFDMAGYSQRHFGMYSGRRTVVRLRCREALAGVVLDRFGLDTVLVPREDGSFVAAVELVVSPQFWGWLFGLGDGAELLSPGWAVEEYRSRLAQVEGLYRQRM